MDDSERWLEAWHDRHAGATSRGFARGQPSSYEWLAELAGPGTRALDLACGDGLLLERLEARGAAFCAGIDISAGELLAARARLGSSCLLVRGRVQSLPFGDAGLDLVTCHLAFMLLAQVEAAVAEIHRVLAPGGRFAAVVGPVRKPGTDAWTELSRRLAAIEQDGPRIGDARTLQETGLRALLSDFSSVRIEPLIVDLSGSPDALWAFFLETYHCDMMEPEALASLEEDVRRAWQTRLEAGSDTLRCSFKLLGLSALR